MGFLSFVRMRRRLTSWWLGFFFLLTKEYENG